MMDEYKELFFDVDGEECVNEELALSILLKDGVLFCNQGTFDEKPTTVLFVQCNDIFAWACADAESLLIDDIKGLIKMHLEDKRWGHIKWCCIRRNEKPQDPIVKDMKQAGVWDDKMEALPENYYWTKIREGGEQRRKDG